MTLNQNLRKLGLVILIALPILLCLWLVFLHPHGFYNMFIKPKTYEQFTKEELELFCPALEEISKSDICIHEDIQTEKDLFQVLEEMVSIGYLREYDEWKLYFSRFEEPCSSPSKNRYGDFYFHCSFDFKHVGKFVQPV